MNSTDELIAAGELTLMEVGVLKRGEEVIVLAGNTPLRGASNLMKVEVIDGHSS